MAWRARAGKVTLDLKYFVVGWLGGNYIARYFDVCEVKGRSMLPTFSEDDGARVLINKIGYPCNGLERGKVYTFRNPNEAQKVIIKRVVGLPGDRFHFIKDGHAQIITVPEGHVWIEGDNLGCSEDSRYYGPIPAGLCIGEAVYQLWPTHKQQRVERVEKPERMYKAPVDLFERETDGEDEYVFPRETAEERCGIEWEATDDLNARELGEAAPAGGDGDEGVAAVPSASPSPSPALTDPSGTAALGIPPCGGPAADAPAVTPVPPAADVPLTSAA